MPTLSGPVYPYIFQLLEAQLNPLESLENWFDKYGDTFRVGSTQPPYTVYFSSPNALRTIFNASPDILSYRQTSQLVKLFLTDSSLIFLPENEHQRQRKLIIPNWHKHSLNSCGQKIIAITKSIIDNLILDTAFDVRRIMQRISLEVILSEIFGSNNYLVREEIKNTIWSLFTLFESPLTTGHLLSAYLFPNLLQQESGIWGKIKHLQRKLEALIDSEIIYRKQHKNARKSDFLSLLLESRSEDGQPMTIEEIQQVMLTLIFAGFETAAAALSWMLYWVYYTPRVKAKLTEELKTYSNDFSNPLAIAKIPYLESVCNETLRINPPSASAFARTVKKPIEIDGHYLEPGTGVNVSIYLAHRREAVFRQANEFKPERFLERQFSPYEFLPFGGGQCRCLGASLAQYEMKLVLATVVSNFELELIKPRPLKAKRHGIVMIPSDLKMKVLSRR